METNIIYNEDCFETLKRLRDNSVDAIVTDPPYHLGFMGKNWDKTGIAERVDLWQECLRVLKPGGNLLSFGGTRTYHRMVCAIEDAGFEIRDCIMWVYGSGFPKSLDISKAIDKKAGQKPIILGKRTDGRYGSKFQNGNNQFVNAENNKHKEVDSKIGLITTPATPEAKLWEGYGTALKPAYEPIVLAMKHLDGTFAENALKWGIAGLNIDVTRIPMTRDDIELNIAKSSKENHGINFDVSESKNKGTATLPHQQGRFPSNFIHDGSQEVMELFPDTKGAGNIQTPKLGNGGKTSIFHIGAEVPEVYDRGGSAARFFYCAKASRREKDMGLEIEEYSYRANGFSANISDSKLPRGNTHPTVKPLALMEYLAKLVTRPQHVVFDPFIGSGTTAMACVKTERRYIGCEIDKDYYDIALKRISAIEKQ